MGGLISPALSSPLQPSPLLLERSLHSCPGLLCMDCWLEGFLVTQPILLMRHCVSLFATHNLSLFDSSVYPCSKKLCFPVHPLRLFINAIIDRVHYSRPVFFSQTQRFTLPLLCQVSKIKYTHSSHLQGVHCLEGKTDKQEITMKFCT